MSCTRKKIKEKLVAGGIGISLLFSPIMMASTYVNADVGQTEVSEEATISEAKQAADAAKKKMTEAETALKSAQQEYQNAGISFLNSVLSENSNVEIWKKAVQNSSDSTIKKSYNETGLTEALSVNNLLKMADLLDECNKLRANDDNFTDQYNQSALKLSPELVLESTISSMISSNNIDHVLFQTDDQTLNQLSEAMGENLAWGYSDPFDGWYTEEKNIYDSGDTSDSEVGHYMNIMSDWGDETNQGITGFGIYTHDGIYSITHAQRFGSIDAAETDKKAYTSAEWKAAVNSYTKSKQEAVTARKNAYNEAKSNYDAAKSAYDKLVGVKTFGKIKLSKSAFVYNGKVQTPAVTVYNKNGDIISSDNYTVSISGNRKNVGQYTVSVTLKNNYSGSGSAVYTINPKGTSVSKLKKAKKAFTVKWKKTDLENAGADHRLPGTVQPEILDGRFENEDDQRI